MTKVTYRIKNSPFITAVISGTLAVVADLGWLVSELALTLGVSSELIHTIVRLGVLGLLVVAIAIAVYSVKLYISNGYAKVDQEVHKHEVLERKIDDNRSKIFK